MCRSSSEGSSIWHPGAPAPCAKRFHAARRALPAVQGEEAVADAMLRNCMARHQSLWRKNVNVS